MMLHILYLSVEGPAGASSGPHQCTTLVDAEEMTYSFATSVFVSDLQSVMGRVYSFPDWESGDAWRTSREYADIGCPFDYPNYLITFGPRGGIKRERA